LAVLSPISLRKEMGRRAAQAKKSVAANAAFPMRARTFNHTQRAKPVCRRAAQVQQGHKRVICKFLLQSILKYIF
jgi:hypothetical protein